MNEAVESVVGEGTAGSAVCVGYSGKVEEAHEESFLDDGHPLKPKSASSSFAPLAELEARAHQDEDLPVSKASPVVGSYLN